MLDKLEKREREERAARLLSARKAAGFPGPKAVADKFGWNINNYKAHESGRNGFGLSDAKNYARAFGVSLQWLNFGLGEPDDPDVPPAQIIDVPSVSWVTAGEMADQEAVVDLVDFPTIPAVDLPAGRWIALKVERNAKSMNKISPPESVIFVNLADRRLVPNACYVITDERGRVTYKRYRPNDDPPFQPASYDDVEPPELEGAITVVGRVKRSMIDM